MSKSNPQRVAHADDAVAAAMEAARSLGRTLGESSVFKRFEAAYEVFQADKVARGKLKDFQDRQQELKMTAMWGGVDRPEQEKLDREWETISAMPSLSEYLRAQNELTTLLREAAGKISKEIGVDYSSACSPSGGCC